MSAAAWLLDLDAGFQAAVGHLELLHLLEYPDCYPIPGSPSHCAVALLWEDEILPVVDLAAWLHGQPMDPLPRLVAVVQYSSADTTIDRGALVLAGPPTLIQVDDELACELPEAPTGWSRVAISCFDWQARAVPVVDLARIFSGMLATKAS